jgi:signal transduction histidine kinase/CheY-like chemotaxis protein
LPLTINEQIKDKVHAEQIKMMHGSTPVLLFINLMVGLALSYGFSDIVPASSIKIVLGLLLLMVVIRGSVYLKYKDKYDPQNLKPFKLSLIIGSASAGVIWGTLSILYFPMDNQTYQLFLLMSLFAMAVGSVFTYSLYLPGYFSYIPAILIPITIQFFIIGDKLHNTLGVVSAVFLLVLTAFNIKLNRNFKTTLALRFQNLDLIAQFKQQKEEAERANKAKSKFLAAASHDLRQPLYSLSLFTSILDESTKNPKTRKIVDQINVSVDALKSLFDALLDISKLDADAVKANKESFPLQPLFKKLANGFDIQASEKGLIIEWPTTNYNITSEADLFEQILRNYLENAIRYTETGKITVKCEVIDKEAVISVCDTGIGIHKSELKNIFTEFHQAGNSERDRKKGLGLGLAIVDRTAKLLEHETSVVSNLGVGSTFSIKIKLSENQVNIPQVLSTPPILSKRNAALLIAVVDDEESIRDGILQLLQLWEYEGIAVASGEELMTQLEHINRQPDVLITDFRLANDSTGIDVINALHAKYQQQIPTLIVTGDTDQKRIEQMNNGHWQVLHKPVPAAKLRAFLRSVQSTIMK